MDETLWDLLVAAVRAENIDVVTELELDQDADRMVQWSREYVERHCIEGEDELGQIDLDAAHEALKETEELYVNEENLNEVLTTINRRIEDA